MAKAKAAKPANIKITLAKSLIGEKPAKKSTASSLGLSKIGDSIVITDLPSTRGKIKSLAHLVTVENAEA